MRYIVTAFLAYSTFMICSLRSEGFIPTPQTAVIDDRDGKTNIREKPSKESAVVGQAVANERFSVWPTDSEWWPVFTKDGVKGFMHKSCIRLMDAEKKPVIKPVMPGTPIEKSAATIAAWRRYQEFAELDRMRKVRDEAAMLAGIGEISRVEVDPAVAGHFSETAAYCRAAIEATARVKDAVRQIAPAQMLKESLREPARNIGGELMPRTGAPESLRSETGKAIGELLVLYCFQDATTLKAMPEIQRLFIEQDRLTVQEALITSALGIELPPNLVRILRTVEERAYVDRLLSGRWIAKEPEGGIADLELTANPSTRQQGGGWLTMRWRNQPRRNNLSFQWQFTDGVFFLRDDTAIKMGLRVTGQKIERRWLSPDVLELTDEQGKSKGTWERVAGSRN